MVYKKKQKILIIAPFPPPVHGSAMVSQYIKDSKLLKTAFDFDYVNLSTSRKMDEIGKKNPIKIWRLFSALFLTFWKLLVHRYDLCYLAITCHGTGFLKDSPFVLICKLFQKKIVIHQHNKGMANDVDKWPYRWLLPLCYKNAKVVLLSWRLYPDIEKIVPRENVLICPNGIPGTKNVNATKPDNNIPRLLFLSNLLIEKGILDLLTALEILKSEGYSFICDVVGAETVEINAKIFNAEIKKRGLNECVFYKGRQYGQEKSEELRIANIFVFPSCNEAFPLVNLEAMENKLPIVTTDEGGITDVVKDKVNGLIAEKHDPRSLAKCIKILLDNPVLRKKMGENGYKIFCEQFTIEVFENKMLEILKAAML